jgi:hypothetical protein
MNTKILMRNGREMEVLPINNNWFRNLGYTRLKSLLVHLSSGICDFQSLQANSGMNLKFNHNQFLSDSL